MTHKLSLVALLNVVAPNLFGHVSCAWCNANLCSFKLFWEEMNTEGGRTPALCNKSFVTPFLQIFSPHIAV